MSEKNEQADPNLGTPDFGDFMDDDNAEINDHHVKGEKSTNEKSIPVGEVIAMTAGMIFSFVASRKGEHWRLTPDEGEQIAETSQQCVDEYMPEFEMSPLWLLAGVTTGIVAPRLLLDMKVQADENEKKQQAQKQKEQADERHEENEPASDE